MSLDGKDYHIVACRSGQYNVVNPPSTCRKRPVKTHFCNAKLLIRATGAHQVTAGASLFVHQSIVPVSLTAAFVPLAGILFLEDTYRYFFRRDRLCRTRACIPPARSVCGVP